MELSTTQDKAMRKVHNWLHNSSEQVFHFFGFAGTGKTTLAKYLAEGVDGEVIFAAFTGKAAHVLASKGCPNACTIHSLIYHSRDKSRSTLKRLESELKELTKELLEMQQDPREHPKIVRLHQDIAMEKKNSDQPMFILNSESRLREAALLVVDEVSMVDQQMGEDLLSFGVKILVLGDPAQLPPIGGAGFFTENVTPEVMLEEIHRQAGDSPIIRMATQVRQGNELRSGEYGNDCFVYDEGYRMDPLRMLEFDQLLVGKNITRRSANNRIRFLKGITDPMPVLGDRLVCLKNNHDKAILNGALFEVADIEGVMDNKVHMTIRAEGSDLCQSLAAHTHYFLGKEDELPWYEKKEAECFDYGYALTCHKSQGSQWDSVCVFDQSWTFKRNAPRWLYTAITRAAENVVIMKM